MTFAPLVGKLPSDSVCKDDTADTEYAGVERENVRRGKKRGKQFVADNLASGGRQGRADPANGSVVKETVSACTVAGGARAQPRQETLSTACVTSYPSI